MSEDVQPVKDKLEERSKKLNGDVEIRGIAYLSKDAPKCEDNTCTEDMDTGDGHCSNVDARLEGDEAINVSPFKGNLFCNHHNSDSSSSEGEAEEPGEFPANWYMPLPQDPQHSDEEGGEEGGDQWSGAAIAGVLEGKEEELKDQGATARVEEIKPASQMEDSELIILCVELVQLVPSRHAHASVSLPYLSCVVCNPSRYCILVWWASPFTRGGRVW